jgi:predicted ATPase
MLERLRIQNFKSWQDTGDMAFGSLTGFFGTNSSGKSSILQFLLMLKQTVESSDRSQILHLGDEHSYIELGTMPDIIFNHNDSNSIEFSFNFNLPFPWSTVLFPGLQIKDEMINKVSFNANIKRKRNFIFLKEFNYGVNNYNKILGAKRTNITNSLEDTHKVIFDKKRYRDEQKLSLPVKPIKFYNFNTQFDPEGWHLIYITNQLANLLENFFTRINYLGPLREYPSRLYLWAGEQTRSVGQRGERAVAALLSSRNQGPTIDMGEGQPKRTVEEHVAHWLKELGLIYSFKVQPIAPNRKEYEVRIQRTAESASVFLTDVGFGVSQILPVLVLLFYVPEGSTVILEQPEIHLHPAVQAGLADVFIDAIKRRKVQIILESHSEHLLQRLQRRIAEEVISQEEIKLYFTSIEEGRSKLTTLELDEYGNIGNWPKGFFGDAFAEAAAKTKAEMKRKMQQQ